LLGQVAGLAVRALVDVLAPILLDAIWQQLKIEALGWVPLQVNGCACGEGGRLVVWALACCAVPMVAVAWGDERSSH